jgi:hypothetical protein
MRRPKAGWSCIALTDILSVKGGQVHTFDLIPPRSSAGSARLVDPTLEPDQVRATPQVGPDQLSTLTPAHLAGPALPRGEVRDRLAIVPVMVGAGRWWRAS